MLKADYVNEKNNKNSLHQVPNNIV